MISMKALRNHFAGEGNSARKFSEAEGLCDFLHYKNERLMEFELFLTKCPKMYSIFEEEVEAMDEDAKSVFSSNDSST